MDGIEVRKSHPDTGIKYTELELLHLEKVIQFCEMAHRTFPYTRIIGWNVFINEKGKSKLIEWNVSNQFF